MDGQSFLDGVRDDHETALSRLGSSKAVYALTGGEMNGETVKAATARETAALADVLTDWTGDADGDAATLFEDVAAFASEHADGGAGDSVAVANGLRGHDGDVARVGALAGGLLVLGKLSEQLVGFFIGDADRKAADSFREFRSEVESHRDDAADLLSTLCADDDDLALAKSAADDAVEAAYDWYVETLEGMGVKPKNVC